MPDHQGSREGHDDGLAQHAGRKQRQRHDIAPRARRFREPQPGGEGGKIEQGRKQILSGDHPGDGLHVQGVYGEHGGDPPRAADLQPLQQPPQQGRVDEVKRHIDRMVAGRREPPELVLEPEGRIEERPVVVLPDGALPVRAARGQP